MWQKLKFKFKCIDVVTDVIFGWLNDNTTSIINTSNLKTQQPIKLSINLVTGYGDFMYPHSVGRIAIIDHNGKRLGDWRVNTFRRRLDLYKIIEENQYHIHFKTNIGFDTREVVINRKSIERIVDNHQKIEKTKIFDLLSIPCDQWYDNKTLIFEVIENINCQKQFLERL